MLRNAIRLVKETSNSSRDDARYASTPALASYSSRKVDGMSALVAMISDVELGASPGSEGGESGTEMRGGKAGDVAAWRMGPVQGAPEIQTAPTICDDEILAAMMSVRMVAGRLSKRIIVTTKHAGVRTRRPCAYGQDTNSATIKQRSTYCDSPSYKKRLLHFKCPKTASKYPTKRVQI